MSSTLNYAQQNLILNPSIEETHHGIPDCDGNNGVYNYPLEFGIYNGFECVKDWWFMNASILYTAKNPPPPNSGFSMPLNFDGYQYAFEGENYGGIRVVHYDKASQTLNYAKGFSGGRFTEPLTQGKEYLFSFYFSVGDSSFLYSNGLGILLHDKILIDPIPVVNYDYIIEDGRIVWQSDTIITEKQVWQKSAFTFTANGGEKMFVVGNFISNEDIDYYIDPLEVTFTHPHVIYNGIYLDNFSLTEITQTDNVTVANNPGGVDAITTFTANLSADATAKLLIYDEAGRIIAQHTFVQDYEQFYLEPLAGAVYYYSFESSNNVKLGGKIVQY